MRVEGVIAQVVVEVGDLRLTAVVPAEGVEHLAVGDRTAVSIKATDLMIVAD